MAASTAVKFFTFSVLLAITKGEMTFLEHSSYVTSKITLTNDEIAQAACAAIVPSGFVSAVQRACNMKSNPSCNTLCRDAACSMTAIYGNQGSTSGTCFQTYRGRIHIYRGRNTLKDSDNGKALMPTIKFGSNGCKSTCPNFCYCKA